MRLIALFTSTLLLALSPSLTAETATARIVGGDDAATDDWPWVVQIETTTSEGRFRCGGNHLSSRWILTAAHCLESANSTSDNPRFVSPQDVTITLNGNAVTPSRLQVHDDYRDLQHDLALLLIPAQGNEQWPSIITLDNLNILESASVNERDEALTALGWGDTGNGTAWNGPLQQVQLDYVPRSECRDLTNLDPDDISDFVICAAELNPVNGINQDTCFGDSGGPLVLGTPSAPGLAGLTSFGEPDCATGAPAGYTNLANETDQIEALTAAAGSPLVDLALSWSGQTIERYYQPPNGEQPLKLTLENTGTHPISNPTLSFSLAGEDAASAYWEDCGGASTGAACTPINRFAGQRDQWLSVSGNNGPDQVVTVTVSGSADEDDYRHLNNRIEQVVVFSNNPDITLSVSQVASNTRQATLEVTLANLSTINAANSTEVLFTLPAGLSLENANGLDCRGTSPTRCQTGRLATEQSKSLPLVITSENGLASDIRFEAVLDGQTDVPGGDTLASLTPQFNNASSAQGTISSGGSGGGGSLAVALLALLMLAGRRQPCSPC